MRLKSFVSSRWREAEVAQTQMGRLAKSSVINVSNATREATKRLKHGFKRELARQKE